MSTLDIDSVYERLWRNAEARGVTINYDGLADDGSGMFHPDPADRGEIRPTITIGRPYCEHDDQPSCGRNPGGASLPPPDILYETVTLAHEIGHFLSWKERTPRSDWEAYFDAARKRDVAQDAVPESGSKEEFNSSLRVAAQSALAEHEIGLILAEEERAWTIGRELLADLGFDRWDYYAERERRGIHHHRYRLGLDELWEEDRGK